MDFVIAFNAAVTVAWWTGASFTILSLAGIGFMFWLRGWAEAARRRRAAVAENWEEILFEATEISAAGLLLAAPGENEKTRPQPARRLDKKDLPHFLYEWNYLHESLAGEAKKGLNRLADELDLAERTIGLLQSPFLDKKILAVNTLGNLGHANTYAEVEKLLTDRDPIISSWAWRALFRIDAGRTIAEHLALIATREDWSPIFVAKVLQEVEADTLSAPLCRLVEASYAARVCERQMSRLISYLILAHVSDYNALVNRILLETNETEVIIACLRLVNSDDDLTRIRALAGDERGEVRLQSIITLGRLGHEEDVPLLVEALNDPDWWVRYRTANVLFSMPGMTEADIEKLARELPNRFARDILEQVLTEMRLLCYTRTSITLSR